jgi:hypothetical protein
MEWSYPLLHTIFLYIKSKNGLGGSLKGILLKKGVDSLAKMAATQSAIFEKMCGVRDILRKYIDYEEIFASPDENPLERDMEGFCAKIHRLMENHFQCVKDAVQAEYSRDHIPKYVGLLSHNLEYVRRRFDSETVVDDGRLYAGLLEIIRTYLEYHLYDLDGGGDRDGNGVYWVLFDQFPEARTWAKEYVRNYAIIVTHCVLSGSGVDASIL